jgi:phosphatidylglycerol:prolipoprotein diacylglycerol transferase
VGARLDSALHSWDQHSSPLWIFNLREGGFAIHGAIFGGMFGNIWRFRRAGYPWLEGLDLALAILLPSMALGRIGCFMQGCCYGSPCDAAWAIQIPGDAVTRHPVQLYESAMDLVLWPVVLYVFFHARRQGQTVCAMLMTYAFIRFTAEFFRETVMWGALSREQWGSVTIFALALLALLFFKGPPRFQPSGTEHESQNDKGA